MPRRDAPRETPDPRAADPDRGSRASDAQPQPKHPRDPQHPGLAPESAHERQDEGGIESGGGVGSPDSKG